MKKINFLIKLKKEGKLKEVNPSKEISNSYAGKSESNIISAKILLENNRLEESVSLAYYSMYNMLTALLFQIGIKCENHFCSIITAEKLLGAEKTATINQQKEKRIDAQYYIRIGKEEEVKQMLIKAKIFVSEFDTLTSNLTNKEIEEHRNKFKSLIK